jgi:hypothetical protein
MLSGCGCVLYLDLFFLAKSKVEEYLTEEFMAEIDILRK